MLKVLLPQKANIDPLDVVCAKFENNLFSEIYIMYSAILRQNI